MTDTSPNQCLVCEGAHGGSFRCIFASGDNRSFACDICGSYTIAGRGHTWLIDHKNEITPIQRALISHKLRTAQESKVCIDDEWLKYLLENETLPTPAMRAANLIRFIGDEVSKTEQNIDRFPIALYAIIGAPNPYAVFELAEELCGSGVIRLNPDWVEYRLEYRDTCPAQANLTLQGWNQYESERRGEFSGDYGFLAMEFGHPDLEDFVKDTIKPAINEFGYGLHDMRDAAQAGIIDNIMRVKIRDARFVIADLTHGNRGAYFEAGYAEALDKPVIYICEKKKFEEEKTHFDTNHCTTIPWAKGEESEFTEKLIATLKRSLE